MLINQINEKWKEYFKDKNQVGKEAMELIRVAYKNAEIENRSKNKEMTDEDTEKVIQKVVKNLNEEYETIPLSAVIKLAILKEQIKLLEGYLPKQLTAEEITNIIRTNLTNKSMPEIMKFFKEHFNGKVDMKLVSDLAKKNIN